LVYVNANVFGFLIFGILKNTVFIRGWVCYGERKLYVDSNR
jgi:hypothetical protein